MESRNQNGLEWERVRHPYATSAASALNLPCVAFVRRSGAVNPILTLYRQARFFQSLRER